jgi:hypothetical protein
MLTIKLAENKQLAALIKKVDSTYRKREAWVYIEPTLTLSNTYWDGGSRSDYHAVNLLTGQISTMQRQAPPQFGGKHYAASVDIPDNVAIIETGYFCGKTATAKVYVNQSNYLTHQS